MKIKNGDNQIYQEVYETILSLCIKVIVLPHYLAIRTQNDKYLATMLFQYIA